jgi:hypothetical protein
MINIKKDTQKINWIVDAGLFAGFCIASLLDLTGLAVHQWLGVAVGVLAGYHLLAHWDWIRCVTQRWFGRTSRQARRFYLNDASLFVGFSLILLTGLVISTWFDLTLVNYEAWYDLHVMTTIITLGLIVVKIGAHWRWVVKISQRLMPTQTRVAHRACKTQPAAVQAAMGRRDFLKLMSVVTVAALVAARSALNNDDAALAQSAGTTQNGLGQDASLLAGLQASDQNSTSSSACFASCNKGCSYPGHCRRYVDANQNNRCDLGECA